MELPKQFIPFKEKDSDWAQKTIDYYISLSLFGNPSSLNTFVNDIEKCFQAYEGILNMNDYVHITKPYGEDTPVNVKSPAQIRNYPIIKPVIDQLFGEYAKRPKNYTVIVKNSDVETLRLKQLRDELSQYADQRITNLLNEAGIDTGKPSFPIQDYQAILQKYNPSTNRDQIAIVVQVALDYIVLECDVHQKFEKGFLDFLIGGCVYSLKEPVGNEMDYTITDPRDVDYDRSPDIDFVEDGEWATVRYRISLSRLIDLYRKDLTDEEIKELETYFTLGTASVTTVGSDATFDMAARDYPFLKANEIEIVRVFWKSKSKRGYVDYYDELGRVQVKEVEDGYKLDKEAGDISIEWLWQNEVWEGSRVAGKFYKRVRPLLVQRTSLDNPSLCKLPVNGRSYYSRTGRFFSLCNLGIPYQILYNTYKYRLEETIAKAKDKVLQLDLNACPDDWELEEWLAYISELGFMLVDYKEYKGNPQHQAVLDLTFSNAISIYLQLLEATVREWEELSGITKQRKGITSASETMGGIERAVVQSAINTEIYNNMFQKFENREYLGLLDVSKFCWIEGKKTAYYLPDVGNIFMDIDGYQHSESNYGVFPTNSAEEQSNLTTAKQLADRLLQSGTPASTVMEMLQSKNMSKIKDLVQKAEAATQQIKQLDQQNESNAAIQLEQTKYKNAADLEKQKQDAEDVRADKKNETSIEVATITAMAAKAGDRDTNDNNIPDVVELGKLALEERKIGLSAKKQEQDAQHNDEKLKVEREKMESAEKIAKMKPKTSGN